MTLGATVHTPEYKGSIGTSANVRGSVVQISQRCVFEYYFCPMSGRVLECASKMLGEI